MTHLFAPEFILVWLFQLATILIFFSTSRLLFLISKSIRMLAFAGWYFFKTFYMPSYNLNLMAKIIFIWVIFDFIQECRTFYKEEYDDRKDSIVDNLLFLEDNGISIDINILVVASFLIGQFLLLKAGFFDEVLKMIDIL